VGDDAVQIAKPIAVGVGEAQRIDLIEDGPATPLRHPAALLALPTGMAAKVRAMITVYEHPLSPYAQKVKIALREKGIEFAAKLPMNIGAGGVAGEFLDANPRAEVPVLIDGATRVFDSTIILEYLEDRWPTPAMLPAEPAERARVRIIEEVMDTHYEAINWGLGEIGWFRLAEGELADRLRTAAASQTHSFYAWLERQLGGRTWFNGPAFGWGDLDVVTYVAASAALGNAPMAGSKLAGWLEQALERPSVAATVGEARAFDQGAVDVAELVRQGLFKREYRDHRLEWMIKSGGLEVVLAGLRADNIRFTEEFS
jgi:glutathione S-transferase/RNA polymerase-associated protein